MCIRDRGWGNRSIDDMMSGIARMVPMTQEQFDAEIAARGGPFAFATSQDQQ